MSSTFYFVLILVAIVMCAEIIKTWLKQKQAEPVVDEELAETLARIDQLEERIQVLERIITENRFDLKKEIDSL
jgi:hypothetical protein